VQIFDGQDKVLIDPFGIDSKYLRPLFENHRVLKVIYDAASDSSLLKNTYNIELKPIMDLRPAVDILGYEKRDLHSVIAAELGVTLTKKEKYQKQNWTRRPIDPGAIEYALNDVTYLLRLKDVMMRKLVERGQLELFFLKNLQVQTRDYTKDPRDRYRKVKGYHGLSGEERRVFRRVFDVREKYAKQCNMPSHNVVGRTDLLEIARNPGHIKELRFPRRFKVELVERIVEDLEEAARG
jgi:ribonuclease D